MLVDCVAVTLCQNSFYFSVEKIEYRRDSDNSLFTLTL